VKHYGILEVHPLRKHLHNSVPQSTSPHTAMTSANRLVAGIIIVAAYFVLPQLAGLAVVAASR
jgi:hypothetical protein